MKSRHARISPINTERVIPSHRLLSKATGTCMTCDAASAAVCCAFLFASLSSILRTG